MYPTVICSFLYACTGSARVYDTCPSFVHMHNACTGSASVHNACTSVVHAYKACTGSTRVHGTCTTLVQALHAFTMLVQALHACTTLVQALYMCTMLVSALHPCTMPEQVFMHVHNACTGSARVRDPLQACTSVMHPYNYNTCTSVVHVHRGCITCTKLVQALCMGTELIQALYMHTKLVQVLYMCTTVVQALYACTTLYNAKLVHFTWVHALYTHKAIIALSLHQRQPFLIKLGPKMTSNLTQNHPNLVLCFPPQGSCYYHYFLSLILVTYSHSVFKFGLRVSCAKGLC
jgi:hypothetical protein